MDQKKTRLPHWPRPPKSVDKSCLLQMHVVGCLVFHGELFSKVFLNYPLCIMMEISSSLSCKEFSTNGKRSLEDCHRYYTFNLIILHMKTKTIYCSHIFTC